MRHAPGPVVPSASHTCSEAAPRQPCWRCWRCALSPIRQAAFPPPGRWSRLRCPAARPARPAACCRRSQHATPPCPTAPRAATCPSAPQGHVRCAQHVGMAIPWSLLAGPAVSGGLMATGPCLGVCLPHACPRLQMHCSCLICCRCPAARATSCLCHTCLPRRASSPLTRPPPCTCGSAPHQGALKATTAARQAFAPPVATATIALVPPQRRRVQSAPSAACSRTRRRCTRLATATAVSEHARGPSSCIAFPKHGLARHPVLQGCGAGYAREVTI